MTIMEDARADVARMAPALGEDAERVSIRDLDWKSMLQAGVLVDLSIGRWRAEVMISYEDLGIRVESREDREALTRVLKLGKRMLLPPDIMEQVARIDRKGRRFLDAYCLHLGWGRFVPEVRYAEWRNGNAVLRDEYFALRDRILNNWDGLVAAVRADYLSVGRQNYQTLVDAGFSPAEDVDTWVDAFVERSMAKLETPEFVRDSYYWRYEVSAVPLTPALVELAGERDYIDRQTDPMRADLARSAAKQIGGGVAQFGADLTAEIRGLVYDAALDCLDAVRKNGGKLPGNSTAQLKRVMASVERLKFWPDRQLEERLAEIRSMVETDSAKRTPAEVRDVLKRVAAEARAVMIDVDRPPARSGANFGVDALAEIMVEQAARRGRPVDVALPVLDDLADMAPVRGRAPIAYDI